MAVRVALICGDAPAGHHVLCDSLASGADDVPIYLDSAVQGQLLVVVV